VRATALTLFANQGVAATSLQMIADELGVSKAAVYHHYRSKSEIVDAVLGPALSAMGVLVERAGRIDSPTQRQALVIDTLAEQAVAHRELFSVMLRELPVSHLLDTTRKAGTFAALQGLLAGPTPDPAAIVGSGIFLSGLVALVTDSRLRELDQAELEGAIRASGRALLGLPSLPQG